MLKKVLPIVLLLIGCGAGVGAGIYLRPPADEVATDAKVADEGKAEDQAAEEKDKTFDYVKLSNQFVVPIVKEKKVTALVVLSLSLEVPEAERSNVFRHEPKLRDSFLQVLFDHANIGGFDAAFTSANKLDALRNALTEVGQSDLGKEVIHDVLITEIVRQDY